MNRLPWFALLLLLDLGCTKSKKEIQAEEPPTSAPSSREEDLTLNAANVAVASKPGRFPQVGLNLTNAQDGENHYFEFYICNVIKPDNCSPSPEHPGRFVGKELSFYAPPGGENELAVRLCAYDPESPQGRCGAYVRQAYTQAGEATEYVRSLLQKFWQIKQSSYSVCSSSFEVMHAFVNDPTTTGSPLRTNFSNLLQASPETACELLLIRDLKMLFQEMGKQQDGLQLTDSSSNHLPIIALGSTAVITSWFTIAMMISHNEDYQKVLAGMKKKQRNWNYVSSSLQADLDGVRSMRASAVVDTRAIGPDAPESVKPLNDMDAAKAKIDSQVAKTQGDYDAFRSRMPYIAGLAAMLGAAGISVIIFGSLDLASGTNDSKLQTLEKQALDTLGGHQQELDALVDAMDQVREELQSAQ